MSDTNIVVFTEVRCSVCRKIVIEVSNRSEGMLRGRCRGCTSILIIDCHIGKVPEIVDIKHKAFTKQS